MILGSIFWREWNWNQYDGVYCYNMVVLQESLRFRQLIPNLSLLTNGTTDVNQTQERDSWITAGEFYTFPLFQLLDYLLIAKFGKLPLLQEYMSERCRNKDKQGL